MSYDLTEQLQTYLDQLDISVKQLRVSATAYAEAERDYKIELRKKCLELKDEGKAVTLIDKICYGIPSVAELRFKRDVAEGVYKANLESINSIKLRLRLLDAQIDREWGAER